MVLPRLNFHDSPSSRVSLPWCPQRPQQNARRATTTSWSRAKITLPVHPRFGEEVAVQWSYGARAVRIETDQHLRLIVPLAWTDLAPRLLAAEHNGRPLHLLPEGLLELAAWVEARVFGRGSEEVGHHHEGDETGGRNGEQGRAAAREASEPGESRPVCSRQQRDQPAVAVVEQASSPAVAGRSRGAGRQKGGEQ